MSPTPGGSDSVPLPHQCLGCDYGDSIPVRIAKGDEAFRRGEYDLAAEIFRLLLPRVARPDRGLCLRTGNSMALSGDVAYALGAFRAAAQLEALQPHELGHLVIGLARVVRMYEWHLPALQPGRDLEALRWGRPPSPARAAAAATPATLRALLGCPRCWRLLYKPVTLLCGRTVCGRCVESGAALSREPQVNVVLSRLLEKCFPTETRARTLADQARNLQHEQQAGAALLMCQHALDLVPGDNCIVLLRAELHLTMESYEQALQDASAVCQNEPFLIEGHHVKAQALSRLGRTKEMLKELLYCLALNPEFQTVKEEAEKVICELFFPDSGNVHQNSASSIQSRMLNTGLTRHFNSRSSAASSLREGRNAGSAKNRSKKAYVFRDVNASVLYFLMGRNYEEDEKILDSVLSIKPSTGSKRQFPDDLVDVPDPNTPGKTPKKDTASLPQRSMDSETGESPGFSIDVTDFECSLCMRLLFQPVTTPCGHMFCRKCFECSLDRASHCPLCKETLSEFLLSRNFNITTLAEELISQYLSDDLSKRKKIYDEEMLELSNLTRDVPILVYTVAFPTVICLLHVSEPRYRLMIRRCMETGTKRFGMCLSTENAGISEYGCMLEIQGTRSFPDGSIDVDAIGVSRFRVLRHRQKGGYNTADIEYFEDEKVEGPEYVSLISLHDSVYQQSVSWFAALQDPRKAQLLSHFGAMPEREPEPQVHFFLL
ncbi:LON peptidase N-terminal domain and RING finger protein 2 [Trichechus inunguis]